jgi:hypothetical protein
LPGIQHAASHLHKLRSSMASLNLSRRGFVQRCVLRSACMHRVHSSNSNELP